MANTDIEKESISKPEGPVAETSKAIKVPKTSVKIKRCSDPRHSGTIKLQGDPRTRCTWCHAILDE